MMWKNNKLPDLRQQYIELLREIYGQEESRQLVDILIEYLFAITRVDMALDPDKRLSESEILQLHQAVKELQHHKPVQYITGKTTFLDLSLKINKSVLIPRPETEELVQSILRNEKNTPYKIIDIGTGSGCIALAVKKHLPETEVTAVDISVEALRLAGENSRANHLDVNFKYIDILTPSSYASFPQYDVVVSNPPYVLESDKKQMQKNVLEFEPETALFVQDDAPLIFYKAILNFCRSHLSDDGRIYFEIHEQKGKEIAHLIQDYNYCNICVLQDIHRKDRFVMAQKN